MDTVVSWTLATPKGLRWLQKSRFRNFASTLSASALHTATLKQHHHSLKLTVLRLPEMFLAAVLGRDQFKHSLTLCA